MKKLRILLGLQILSWVIFVGGGIFVIPKIYSDGIPLFLKIFVSIAVIFIFIALLDNALSLRNAYRREKKQNQNQ